MLGWRGVMWNVSKQWEENRTNDQEYRNCAINKVLSNEWILKFNSPLQKLSESNIPVIHSACDAANYTKVEISLCCPPTSRQSLGKRSRAAPLGGLQGCALPSDADDGRLAGNTLVISSAGSSSNFLCLLAPSFFPQRVLAAALALGRPLLFWRGKLFAYYDFNVLASKKETSCWNSAPTRVISGLPEQPVKPPSIWITFTLESSSLPCDRKRSGHFSLDLLANNAQMLIPASAQFDCLLRWWFVVQRLIWMLLL